MERVWLESYDSRVPQSIDYPEECLPVLLEQNLSRYGGHTATSFLGAQLTYSMLWNRILKLASGLRSLGVGPGSKVAIMLPNCPQAIMAYYAALRLGAVVVLTNPLYVQREMVHQWNDAEAEFLVVLDHLYPKVKEALPRTAIKTLIVTTLKEELPLFLRLLYPLNARKNKLFTKVPYGDGVLSFKELVDSHEPVSSPCQVKPDDLALLQYTGGTTGVAKGVMLSHRNIQANVVQVTSWFPDLNRGGERFLSILPFSHVFGMTVSMNMPLYTGSEAVLLPRFEIRRLLKTLQKKKVTLLPGVPTLFSAIMNHDKVRSYDMSSIRYCVTGSAPMPVEVLKQFESMTGSVIIEGYGLTEASPVTHCNPLGGTRKAGSIGIALPDTDCRIVDLEKGEEELSRGENGELVVRGPQVMQSYWKMEEETAETLKDGWLRTGDIARMDEDGYVYVVDRIKDMIITKGYNIYPREIDEVLYEHPKILDAVAVGVPDPHRGETVKAYVVVKEGEKLEENEVISFCRERLAAYKVPRLVEFRDALPKNMVGKVLRKELRKEYENHMESNEESK